MIPNTSIGVRGALLFLHDTGLFVVENPPKIISQNGSRKSKSYKFNLQMLSKLAYPERSSSLCCAQWKRRLVARRVQMLRFGEASLHWKRKVREILGLTHPSK